MLFDLRATGRRRVVKVVYVFLALLIGGGLVLFGVGGSGFGLLNADQNSGGGGTGTSVESQALKLEKSALKPKPGASDKTTAGQWGEAAKLRFQAAGAGFDSQTGAYSDNAVKQLKLADQDWQQYLKLTPGQPELVLAKLMAQAYGPGALNQAPEAVKSWQIVVAAEPTGPNYALLATSAYLANQNKLAEKAAAKALELTPAAQRSNLKAQFKAAKAQAKAAARAAAAQANQQQSSGNLGGLP